MRRGFFFFPQAHMLSSWHEASAGQDVECRWSAGGFPPEWGRKGGGDCIVVGVAVGKEGITFLLVRIRTWQPRLGSGLDWGRGLGGWGGVRGVLWGHSLP